MPRHDLVIDNQTFPAFRGDLNAFLQAISSQQSAAGDTTSTVQFQYSANLTTNLLSRRNVGDSAFLPFDTLLDLRVDTKTANYTHLLADMNRVILLDATSGNLTVTLLDAAIAKNGFRTTFKRIDSSSNTVLLDNFGGQTIDGVADLGLVGKNDAATIHSNGSNYFTDTLRVINPTFIRQVLDFPVEPINVTSTYQNATLKFFQSANVSPVWRKALLGGKVFMSWNLQGPGTGGILYDQRILGGDGTVHFETLGTDGGDIGAANSQIDGILLSAGNSTNLDLSSQDLVGINFAGAAGGGAAEAWNWQIKSQSGDPNTTPRALRFIWVW